MSNSLVQSTRVNRNKIVELFAGVRNWRSLVSGRNVPEGVFLYPESDFSMNASNEYADPLEKIMETARKTKFIKSIMDAVQTADSVMSLFNIRLMTRLTGAQAWNGSSTLDFSLSFKFYYGMSGLFDGEAEVFNPIVNLAYWSLPVATSGLTMEGPAASYAQMVADYAQVIIRGLGDLLRRAGESLKGFFDSESGPSGSLSSANNSSSERMIGEAILRFGNSRKVYFGSPDGTNTLLRFDNVLPTSFKYSFSREMDSRGFPIAGNVDIQCKTLLRAAANDLMGVTRVGRRVGVREDNFTIGSIRGTTSSSLVSPRGPILPGSRRR